MIVKARSIPYRVGLYQLINYGLLAVPLRGKTGPALYISVLGVPLTVDLHFMNPIM